MEVFTNGGGSMEFVQNGFSANGVFYSAFRHFQALASELSTPQVLICPVDVRLPAANFARLQNENVSYFVGVDADFSKPASILAGDRNLATNSLETPTILQINAGSRLWWTRELHQFKGNVLFADGHVEEWNNSALVSAANNSSATASLFLPSVPPGANMSVGGMAGSSGSGAGTSSSVPFTAPPAGNSRNANTNAGTQLAATLPANSQTNRPSGIASGSNRHFNQNQTPPAGPDSPSSATPSPAPIPPSASSSGAAASADTDWMMSPFNRRLARFLQHLIEWTYLLLLLLLLLYLAYKLWRWWQQRKEQKQMAELKRMAQETVLDSEESIR
jgi:prepilin-type processing-associated H-X9-DG protein